MKRQNLNILLLGLILMISSGCNLISNTPPTESEVKSIIESKEQADYKQIFQIQITEPHKFECEYNQPIKISEQKNSKGYFIIEAPWTCRALSTDGGKILKDKVDDGIYAFQKSIFGGWSSKKDYSALDVSQTKARSTPIYDSKKPIAPEWDKYLPVETKNFYLYEKSRGVVGYTDGVTGSYNYSDKKYDKYRTVFDDGKLFRDFSLKIKKFSSSESAKGNLNERLSKAITKEQADKLKFPKCDTNGDGEKDNEYSSPEEIVKKIPHKNGSEIVILHYGRFWMGDCKSLGTNGYEYIFWVNDVYLFEIEVWGYNKGNPPPELQKGFGRGEEFLNEYLEAIGQK